MRQATLHSEQGALAGEHPGRARNPVIKVADLAWLELEKPDLEATATFAHDFGFHVAYRSDTELHLRGTQPGPPALVVRRGRTARFVGAAFRAAEAEDLHRLAVHTGTAVAPLRESLGGQAVRLVDPSGFPVAVVAGTHAHGPLPSQQPLTWNSGIARFGLLGTAKVVAVPYMRAAVHELGFTVTHYRLVGCLELAAVAGLFLGLRWSALALAAAIGLGALMLCALRAHVRNGDGPRHLVPAAAMLAVAVPFVAT